MIYFESVSFTKSEDTQSTFCYTLKNNGYMCVTNTCHEFMEIDVTNQTEQVKM